MVIVEFEELQVAASVRAVGVETVGVKAHHAIFQGTFEMNAVGLVVHPVLYPLLSSRIVVIEALTAAASGPILEENAFIQDELNAAGARRIVPLRRDHVPFANPEIKLAIFGLLGARMSHAVGFIQNLGKAGISVQSCKIGILLDDFGAGESSVNGLVEQDQRIGIAIQLCQRCGLAIKRRSPKLWIIFNVLISRNRLLVLPELVSGDPQVQPGERTGGIGVDDTFVSGGRFVPSLKRV